MNDEPLLKAEISPYPVEDGLTSDQSHTLTTLLPKLLSGGKVKTSR